MNEVKTFVIKEELLIKVMNYLATKPYVEVAIILNELQMAVQQVEKPKED